MAGWVAPALLALPRPLAGLSFSPAGMLFPYHAGVAYALKQGNFIDSNTKLGGSSAGAIIATAIATDVQQDAVDSALRRLSQRFQQGTTLRDALRDELLDILPDDAPQRARGRLTVAYQQVLPWPRKFLVTEWESKNDLIDTICASCCWPFFFSRWPMVWVRGGLAVDGFFALPRSRFGCPPVAAQTETLHVVAIPGIRTCFDGDVLIQPGSSGQDLPVAREEWFSWAYSAASEESARRMASLGRSHALNWVEQQVVELVE